MMEKCVLLSPHEQTNSSLQNAAQMATSAGSWLVLSSVNLNPTFFIQLEMVRLSHCIRLLANWTLHLFTYKNFVTNRNCGPEASSLLFVLGMNNYSHILKDRILARVY